MWMMGYPDGCEFNNMAADHSFNGRKFRPLIPRPPPCTATTTTTTTKNNRIKATDFFALNHSLGSDQAVSSRWNPTQEQLRALEDLYRRGTRTPSADQIQHITAQLRQYGKIEGKNVFYWFQNHKARERQKRRRQMESNPDQEHINLLQENLERKETGSSRTFYELEQTKNWAPSINCSTLAEESVSRSRATKAVMTECRPDRCVQINEGESQDRRNSIERNATWQMMQAPLPTHHLILNTEAIASLNTRANITAANNISTATAQTASNLPRALLTIDTKGLLNKTHQEDEVSNGESQTLQLFPLRSDEEDGKGITNEKERETLSIAEAMKGSSFTTSYQFYEFLPLKN